jgi:hypothetical protein
VRWPGSDSGLVVAVVLVHVVNPQSFHWTMDLMLPWPRLLLLCLAVVLAGTLTAWLAGRNAAGQHAVLAVREVAGHAQKSWGRNRSQLFRQIGKPHIQDVQH